MSGDWALSLVLEVVTLLVAVSLVGCFVRLVRGPALADRAVALDLIAIHMIVVVALEAIRRRDEHLVDVLLGIGLVNFLVLIGIAYFMFARAEREENKS